MATFGQLLVMRTFAILFILTLLLTCSTAMAQFNVIATVDRDTICAGDTIYLSMTIDSHLIGCGVTGLTCNGPDKIDSIPLGHNIQTGSPVTNKTVYGNYARAYRMQFLYLASELRTEFQPGNIKALAWEVGVFNSNSTLENFMIKVSCLPQDSTTITNWQTGLQTVYSVSGFTPNNGWNNHNLSSPYYWDGFSNLVIEVSHFNPVTFSNLHNMMVYTNEPGKMIYAMGGNTNVISNDSVVPTAWHERPKLRMHMCETSLGYTVLWSPSTGPNAVLQSQSTSATAIPATSQTYQVDVNYNGSIYNSNAVTVFRKNSIIPTINHIGDLSVCKGDTIDVELSVVPSYKSYLWNTGDTSQVINVNQPGVYKVTVTDIWDCVMNPMSSIDIHRYPDTVIITPAITNLCPQSNQTLRTT